MLATKWLTVSLLLLATGAPEAAPRKGKHTVVYGSRPAAVERISSHAEDAAARFTSIYGSFPGKKVAIVLYGAGELPEAVNLRRVGAGWQMPVPDLPESDPEEGEEDDGSFLRDTLADFAFRRHVDERAHASLRKAHNDCGSYLADWLDEAVKCLCQTEAVRKRGAVDLAGRLGAQHIPLEELFTIRYDVLVGLDTKNAPRPSIQVIELTERQALFRDQSGSVAEYLIETYGVGFWRHVVDTFAKAREMKHAVPWLSRNRRKLANPEAPIPKTVVELEQAWLAWAKARKTE